MLILDDPIKAAQVRVDMLQQAKRSVKAQYFIVGRDPLTYAGLALARDAAWRGCDVKILIDAAFNDLPPAVSGYLSTQGVQIKVYHRFSLAHPTYLTRHMHDKGLSIDGQKMIRGGRNVQDSYFGRAPKNFIDRDAYLEGQVVCEADIYFDRLWESQEVCWLENKPLDLRAYEAGRAIINEARETLATSTKWKLDTQNDWGKGLPELGPVRFLHDPIGKKDVEPGVSESLRDLIRLSKRSILIETPYLVPTPELFREIRSAQRRGVCPIEFVTNSARSNDGLYAQAGYEAAKRKLLKAGVKLWEFKGADTLHAKSAVIDEEWVVVGSFNADPRSQHLNTETAVAVRNRTLANELRQAIQVHQNISWPMGPSGRPVEDAQNYPGTSRSTRFKLALLRLTLPLIWGQL